MFVEPPSEVPGPSRKETPPRPCWRCGKLVDAQLPKCPLSRRLSREILTAQSGPPAASKADRALMRMLIAYAVLLSLSVVFALIVRLALAGSRNTSSEDMLTATLVLEGLHSLVVLVAVAFIPMRGSVPAKTISEKAVAWVVFVPVLVMLLALNFAYHWIIRTIAHVDLVESEVLKDPAPIRGWIVAVCIQPAVIEELFFRYLALGAIRLVTGVHTAVIISAVMFGMLHLGVPLSIPLLIVLGLGLGYAGVQWRDGAPDSFALLAQRGSSRF